MIIDNLNIRGARRITGPLKTETPLVIDPDAELAFPVAGQRFKAIAAQNPQIIQGGRRIKNGQSFSGLIGEALKPLDEFAGCKCFCFPVSKINNHVTAV